MPSPSDERGAFGTFAVGLLIGFFVASLALSTVVLFPMLQRYVASLERHPEH